MAETEFNVDAAFDFFIGAYRVKYDRAAKCLTKDRADLLAINDFPAEHRRHIWTTNLIESTFDTVRHRSTKIEGRLNHQPALDDDASADALSQEEMAKTRRTKSPLRNHRKD